MEMFTKAVGSDRDCKEYLKENFCTIIAYLVPWFAVQSRNQDSAEVLTSEKEMERQARSDQASQSHEYLLNALKTEVGESEPEGQQRLGGIDHMSLTAGYVLVRGWPSFYKLSLQTWRYSQSYEFSLYYLKFCSLVTFQKTDKLMAKKFDELVVQLLLRMYEPPTEGSDVAQFTK